MFSEFRSFKEMVGITVAEPIVPIYLDRAALRKLKMQDGKDNQYYILEMFIFMLVIHNFLGRNIFS